VGANKIFTYLQREVFECPRYDDFLYFEQTDAPPDELFVLFEQIAAKMKLQTELTEMSINVPFIVAGEKNKRIWGFPKMFLIKYLYK
jgi:hypothetical protein